ncbi:hypothetical protein ACTFR8_23385 [Bacillus cereus group sp. MYBK15-3]|uniref:hypothetical protein n=1 Tax=unclassified Bacillus cereus group TaxID=2750818 RepID=UPI003F796116
MSYITKLADISRKIKEEKITSEDRNNVDTITAIQEVQHELSGLEMRMTVLVDLGKIGAFGLSGKTIADLHRVFSVAKENLINVFALHYDNYAKVTVEFRGQRFTMLTFEKKGYFEVLVYNMNGNEIIYREYITIKDNLYDVTLHIANKLTKYMGGFIECAGCHDGIKKEDVVGKIYAGSFCKECWEEKGYKQEADFYRALD